MGIGTILEETKGDSAKNEQNDNPPENAAPPPLPTHGPDPESYAIMNLGQIQT